MKLADIMRDIADLLDQKMGGGVTLRLAGTAATGNRTLARYGVATIVCVASETFVISGAGLV